MTGTHRQRPDRTRCSPGRAASCLLRAVLCAMLAAPLACSETATEFVLGGDASDSGGLDAGSDDGDGSGADAVWDSATLDTTGVGDTAPMDSGPTDGARDADLALDADTGARDTGVRDSATTTDVAVDLPPDVEPDVPYAPALYPGDALLSPITDFVADRLSAIAANDSTRQDDVFMKVGASGTVSHNLLWCFAGEAQPQYVLDLDGRDGLMDVIDTFRGGDAAGDTPFDRPTEAAVEGRTAGWAISGDPSPVEIEIAAINPRFAFVNYGTNDMQMGTTHLSALPGFYVNLSSLLDQLIEAGIIPIVTGLNPRSDTDRNPDAPFWVPTYNAVTRALAQHRQLPFIDMFLASKDLPNQGLTDGVHGTTYVLDGSFQPCVFTAAGLEFNYNVRNLLSIEVLDAIRRVVVLGEPVPDRDYRTVLEGDGSMARPFRIDALPFGHVADTRDSGQRNIDVYSGCTNTDEGGPEYLYRMELTEATRVRAVVTDGSGVDIDVHLLDASATAEGCLQRGDRVVQGPLEAGTYFYALDTWVDTGGNEYPGEYVFVVHACEPGDPACN